VAGVAGLLSLAASVPAAAQSVCAAPVSGLVALWSAEGSGAEHFGRFPATPGGTLGYTAGATGQAFNIAGAGYLAVVDNAELRPARLTVSAWVRATSFTGSWDSVVSKGASGGDPAMGCCGDSYWLGTYAGRPRLHMAFAGGDRALTGPSVLSLNTWHHLAATFDGATVRLFVDGAEVAALASTLPIAYDSGNVPLVIGDDINSGSLSNIRWRGAVDEVALYDRALSAAELAALAAARGQATCVGTDGDGDGVGDDLDAFPCQAGAVGEAYAPAAGAHALLLFEDQWPAQGDLDFNDAVVAYNYAYQLDPAGLVQGVTATYDVLALGGDYDNGLGLHLPVPAAAVSQATLTVGAGAPQALSPQASDAEATFVLFPSLRTLFAGQGGPINSLPSLPRQSAPTVRVQVDFHTPQPLAAGEAPHDVYLFRAGDAGHQIHRPEFGGTAAMRTALFGTQDDRSTAARRFVDTQGLPFALVVPEATPHPAEGVGISALFPDILAFAGSAGATHRDFYATAVVASAAYRDVAGQPAPSPGMLPSALDVSCLPPTSCADAQARGATASGVYTVRAGGLDQPVWCDLSTAGGGWTVLEKSPYGSPVGAALYRDVAVSPSDPSAARHRLGRSRMNALVADAQELRIDCRGNDRLVTSVANLFNGEGGANDCNNRSAVLYTEASAGGRTLTHVNLCTWYVSRSEGCAGAFHVDEWAQSAYCGLPNAVFGGSSPSSADLFGVDPVTAAPTHDCHKTGATRYVMVRGSARASHSLGGAQNPGASCRDVLARGGSTGDGVYWIRPLGQAAFPVWCDMSTDGGGWTVVERSPYGQAVGRALYEDVPVSEALPGQSRHRLGRARMAAVAAGASALRVDCRGQDYLLTSAQNLFLGEGGPNTCFNNQAVLYSEARLQGHLLTNTRLCTWFVGSGQGCAGAWHVDEWAQAGYCGLPNFPWTGAALSNSSGDLFAADPGTVVSNHECHRPGAVRHVLLR
jgi:LruC domain-containing protein